MDKEKPCPACQSCFMEPDGPFCCGHEKAGILGLSLSGKRSPRLPGGFCGPEGKYFKQHPLRDERGNLNSWKK